MANSTKKVPLTPVQINKLKPDEYLTDSGENAGLRISCNKSGVKTFFYRYKSPIEKNRVKQVSIGVYVKAIKDENLDAPLGEKKLGLSSARYILQSLKVDRAAGICHATVRKQEKAEAEKQKHQKQLSVKDLVEVYLSQHIEDHKNSKGKLIKGVRKPKGQVETRRTLMAVVGKGEPSDFGKRPAVEITHVDIKNLISSIIAKGTQVQAGRVLAELNLAWSFAIGRPIEEEGVPMQQWKPYLPDEQINPCMQAKEYFKHQRVKLTCNRGTRFLDDNEIRLFLEWLPTSKFTKISKHALWLTLLTGVRSGEAVNARKSKFDLECGTWSLEAEDTKTGVARQVQLSTQVCNYLRPIIEDPKNKTDWLLPSSRTGYPQHQKQLSEQAYLVRREDQMLDIPNWTAHDLRRTCRTGLARLGCPSEIAELVLGHTKQGIEGVYNLHQYEKEQKEWLQIWSDHLDMLQGNISNVVPMIKKEA